MCQTWKLSITHPSYWLLKGLFWNAVNDSVLPSSFIKDGKSLRKVYGQSRPNTTWKSKHIYKSLPPKKVHHSQSKIIHSFIISANSSLSSNQKQTDNCNVPIFKRQVYLHHPTELSSLTFLGSLGIWEL